MDLKQAAKLLGLTPNAVRHRAKKAKSPFDNKDKPYEIDNRNKWWVFLDPDALPASNDTSTVTSNVSSNSTSKRASNEARFEGEIKALQGHVETLTEGLAFERAEVARLRAVEAESVELKVKAAGLDAALSAERVETARLRLVERDAGDLRVKVAALTGELDALKARPRRWWWFW
jgi:hypothetical protein